MKQTCIGVLGGGQLGRMLGLAGIPLGVRFRFLDPAADAPARRAGELIIGALDDPAAVDQLARGSTAATYEFENVPVAAAERLAQLAPLRPGVRALTVAQDRWTEKQFFAGLGIPLPAFGHAASTAEIAGAIGRTGLPCVIKTQRLGYDGKGQSVARDADAAVSAFEALGGVPVTIEQHILFERELSIIGVRGGNGATGFYPLIENVHTGGILRTSRAPAPRVTSALQAEAEQIARTVMESLDYVGVLAIELFDVGGRLLVNELAPRVHNSGHWTIEGAETSQFENHVRAVVGMPLGSTAARGDTMMFNLIGSAPPAELLLAVRGAHLHWYEKQPRPGRKIGHVSITAADDAELHERCEAIRKILDGLLRAGEE